MEAIIDKKSPNQLLNNWKERLFRLRCHSLMHFKSSDTKKKAAKISDSAAKYTLDLTKLESLKIHPKIANVLTILTEDLSINIQLRFKTNEACICWLKVLSTFTNENENVQPIPSNYLESIWHVLQALYTHIKLQYAQNIFDASKLDKKQKTEQNKVFNKLLQKKCNTNKLKLYENIYVLAQLLCSLLSNLPSTILPKKQINILLSYVDQNQIHIDEQKHVDDDVANISQECINKLKHEMEISKYRHRYALMTIIFHLLKQIITNEQTTKETAESLSIIFGSIMFSKQMETPKTKYLTKVLIYWAYVIFPEKEWRMNDIVIVEECEKYYIEQYQKSHDKSTKNRYSKRKSMKIRAKKVDEIKKLKEGRKGKNDLKTRNAGRATDMRFVDSHDKFDGKNKFKHEAINSLHTNFQFDEMLNSDPN
eukprot:289471_1